MYHRHIFIRFGFLYKEIKLLTNCQYNPLCSTAKNTSYDFGTVFQWSEFLATDPEVRVRYPALPDSLRSSGSGTGTTQPREYN
jgi:hypothetical protein